MTNSNSSDGKNNFECEHCCCGGEHNGHCCNEDDTLKHEEHTCFGGEIPNSDNSDDAAEIPQTAEEDDSLSGENDWHDRFLRVCAEFDNFKKRTLRERELISTDAALAVFREILPLFDNLERASKVNAEGEEALKLKEGIQAIYKQFSSIFQKLGVTRIETLGQQFNPEFHNAVLHTEDENYPPNHIVEEMLPGYMYKDKVIRHSMVRVAN